MLKRLLTNRAGAQVVRGFSTNGTAAWPEVVESWKKLLPEGTQNPEQEYSEALKVMKIVHDRQEALRKEEEAKKATLTEGEKFNKLVSIRQQALQEGTNLDITSPGKLQALMHQTQLPNSTLRAKEAADRGTVVTAPAKALVLS